MPDIVTVSKSISGYGLPMSLTLMRPELDQWTPGEHTGTFRGPQLAFVTAAAALTLFDTPAFQERLATNTVTIAQRLVRDVAPADTGLLVRGLGMLWGVDTAALDPTGTLAKKIATRCFADGLIIETAGRSDTVLKLLPPLNIEPEILAHGLEVLGGAVTACLT